MNDKESLMIPKLRELTDYPEVYYCYWGSFRKDKFTKPIIIENRNKFAKEYDLAISKTKRRVKRPVWIDKYLSNIQGTDHIECYKDKSGNYIVIFSAHNPIKDLYGFKEIYPLYDIVQTSYCIKLPQRKSQLLKEAFVEINGEKVNINMF
jgi:hypothetical protein